MGVLAAMGLALAIAAPHHTTTIAPTYQSNFIERKHGLFNYDISESLSGLAVQHWTRTKRWDVAVDGTYLGGTIDLERICTFCENSRAPDLMQSSGSKAIGVEAEALVRIGKSRFALGPGIAYEQQTLDDSKVMRGDASLRAGVLFNTKKGHASVSVGAGVSQIEDLTFNFQGTGVDISGRTRHEGRISRSVWGKVAQRSLESDEINYVNA